MRHASVFKILALVSALPVIGTGCGGFYAAPSVSPLMFLLPGLGQAKPTLVEPAVPGRTETNWTVAQANINLCDSPSR